MEHHLRCNAVKCRRELTDQAVVTTCSHVFCTDCANQLQLSNRPPGSCPICPACDVHLKNPDDAVITNLNPTEDYKTSILSGLNPHIIMECATRALSFWAYQSTQEIVYYDYLAKALTEKYTALNSQLDKVVHDANSELQELRSKVANLQADQIALRRKNAELVSAYNEKSQKQMRTQELFDRMKRQSLLEHVQEAASEAVDDSINASMAGNRFPDRIDENMQQRQTLSMFPLMRTTRSEPVGMTSVGITPAGNRMRSNDIFSSQESNHDVTGSKATPSHRQRLTNLGPQMTVGIGMNSLSNAQAPRPSIPTPTLRRVSPSSTKSPLGGLSGYGMSAGVKFSQPRVQSSSGENRQASIPPRVAQRPASGWGLGMSGNLNTLGQNLPNTERYF